MARFESISTFIFGVAIGCLAMGVIALATTTDDDVWRKQAIDHGAARWDVAPDGSKEFRWNEPRSPCAFEQMMMRDMAEVMLKEAARRLEDRR